MAPFNIKVHILIIREDMLRQFDDLQDICRRVTSMGRIRETDDLTMAVAICLVKGHRTPPAYTSL